MFHVLLCDDELLVTDFLVKNIPWENLGIETVYTASNGLEAFTLIQEHPIDLLITDIRMPQMDGLSLLEKIRAANSNIHCILLTAYGEFEYAKTAFKLGVDNYLLKPIQISELTDTIENTVENIYISRKSEETLFRENILRRWLNGSIGEDELAERSSILFDINIYQNSYCAVCITKIDTSVHISTFAEKCSKLLNQQLDCLHVWDNQGKYVLIISGTKIDRSDIYQMLSELVIQMHLEHKLCIAIGNTVNQSEQLQSSYQSCISFLNSLNIEKAASVNLVPQSTLSLSHIDDTLVMEALSPIIKKAIKYIHLNYAAGVSIKEFCATHTITTAYLGYLFKKETNTFFNTYLNTYRLEKACALLTETQEKIHIIAEKTGFTSASYFISSFKKYTNMSPQKYREMNQ